MTTFISRALDRGLELNERLALAAGNGFDWLFRRDELVQSGRTDYEIIYVGELMSVRYYGPPAEREIQLANGNMMRVVRKLGRPLQGECWDWRPWPESRTTISTSVGIGTCTIERSWQSSIMACPARPDADAN